MLDFRGYAIPERMYGGITRYVKQRIPTGSFLEAILSNDLKEAVGRADQENRDLIVEYVKFMYNQVPAACWGSKENYEQWIKGGAKD